MESANTLKDNSECTEGMEGIGQDWNVNDMNEWVN